MKVLINTPHLSLKGGVANHYKGLKPFWNLEVKYNYVGGRYNIPGLLILPFDYIKFVYLCLFGKIDLIILNPSLNKKAIIRDALFLKIATLFKKKCIVFWHGWNPEMVDSINKNQMNFKRKFNRVTKHLVLSKSFKNDLVNWGVTAPIILTTTKVDDRLLDGFEIQNKKNLEFNILFLSRIEMYKGIFIVLDAFKLLQSNYPKINLYVAGDGSQLVACKEFAKKHKLKNVNFLGNIHGNQLIESFTSSSIYILPSYSEGMPTSVLEAMAFGLPVITRPVGGLNDFFEDGKMGCLIESLEPKEYAQSIAYFIENREVINEIGLYNHKYAKSNFLASQVALKLESTFIDD